MAKEKSQPDRPNRRTIELLLREFNDTVRNYRWNRPQELLDLEKEADEREAFLAKDTKLVSIKAKLKAANRKHDAQKEKASKLVQEVRQAYLIKGVTDEVIESVDKLRLALRKGV